MQIILFLAFILIAVSSSAAGLANRNYNLSDALLPKGLWMVGYDYQSSGNIQTTYNNSGSSEAFTTNLGRELKVSDILKRAGDPFEQALSKAAFEAYGIGPNESAGYVVNNLEVAYQSSTFVVGRGITDNFSVFFIAPKISMDTRLSTRLEYSAPIKSLIQTLEDQGQRSKADEIRSKADAVLADMAEEYGYEDAIIDHWEGVPSFMLSGRYTTDGLKQMGFSFETRFIIPNEHDLYIDNLLPVDFLEESPSLLQSVYYNLYSDLNTNAVLYSHYQLRTPFHKKGRLPEEDIFGEQVGRLRVKYGDEWQVGSQISQMYGKIFRPYLNLNYIYKFKDNYQSSDADLSVLEEDTQQELLLAGAGAQLDLVDRFLAGKFIVPMILSVQYSKSLAGRNAFDNDIYSLNALVFVK